MLTAQECCLCGRVPYGHRHEADQGCPENRVLFSDLPIVNDLFDEELDKAIDKIYN